MKKAVHIMAARKQKEKGGSRNKNKPFQVTPPVPHPTSRHLLIAHSATELISGHIALRDPVTFQMPHF